MLERLAALAEGARRLLLGVSPDELKASVDDVRAELRAARAELRQEVADLRRDVDALRTLSEREDRPAGVERPVPEA